MRSLEELWSDPALRPETDRAGCPSAEVLAELASGTVAEAERSRLVDHLVDCADCSAELRALQALAPWAVAAEEGLGEVAPVSRARGRSTQGWVAAAALVAAAGLGWLVGSGYGAGGSRVPVALAANPAIVDLLPEGALRASTPQDRQRLELPAPGGAPAVLVLHLDRPAAEARYSVEFVRGGSTAARLEGLEAGPFGTLTLMLTGEGLAPGDYDLVLRAAPGDSGGTARYQIQFAHGD